MASELQNFSQTQKAYETALHSSGSALKENEAYAESLEYKIQMLKKAFQDLANSIASSDLLKQTIDMGTALLEFANTDIGAAIIQLGLFTTAVIALSRISFGVFVGQVRAHCGQNRVADEVLGCNQFQMLALARQLLAHRVADFGINSLDGFEINHSPYLPS